MKTTITLLLLAALPLSVSAADLTGTWRAQFDTQPEFDTQRGPQFYTFTLKQGGATVTGTVDVFATTGSTSAGASLERSKIDLKEGKVDGDKITFVEPLSIRGKETRIAFTGKISSNEIKLTRDAGEFGISQATARLVAAPIRLGPDDKPAFPDPPAGCNAVRDSVPHGEVTVIQYDSKSLESRGQMRVYTPPGYTTNKKYPVVYLLHGLRGRNGAYGNDRQWLEVHGANNIVDNLLADGNIQPFIMVLPNCDANMSVIDPTGSHTFRNGVAGFERYGRDFENDLLEDIIPYVESHYSVVADRNHRALAGMTIGAKQTLSIGLSHADTFAFLGAFTLDRSDKSPAELLPDPAVAKKLKLLWLGCGSEDAMLFISQDLHRYLKEKDVPHVWNVSGKAQDVWTKNLYQFVQQVFK